SLLLGVAAGVVVVVAEATVLRFALASARAFDSSAFACFLHALFSAPFMSSHFSCATSYAALALATSTSYSACGVPLRLASSSAMATFSWPFASFSQTALALPLIDLHFSFADL